MCRLLIGYMIGSQLKMEGIQNRLAVIFFPTGEEITRTLEAKLSGEPLEVLPIGGSYWLGFEE